MATRIRFIGKYLKQIITPRKALIIPVLFGSAMITQKWLNTQHLQVFAQGQPTPQQSPAEKLELFSQEKYESYQKDKFDIIIVYDPDRFMDSFQDEVLQLIQRLTQLKDMKPKSRKLKIMKLPKLNPEEQKQFEEKYGCQLEFDTILLLRNKYIPVMNSFGAQEYFESKEFLMKYFEKLNKINQNNFDNFTSILKFLPADNTIMLLKTDKKAKLYKNLARRFSIVQLQDTYSKNKNIHWFMIDDYVADKLNLKDTKDGQLYFMLKSSLNINKQHNYEFEGKKFYLSEAATLANSRVNDVVESNAVKFNALNLFAAKSFEISNPLYTIVLECDMNKLPRQEWKTLMKQFSEFRDNLKANHKDIANRIELVAINRHIDKPLKKYKVYIRNDQQIMDRMSEHSATTMEQIKSLLTYEQFNQAHSYTYLLKEEATNERLMNFFQDVQDGKVKEYYKSQKKPNYRKYSVKLCGRTFQEEVLNFEDTCVVFHYSKNCHACKQYGGQYENLALESLRNKDSIKYSRLNNDRNSIDCSVNFPYTPVFEIFKKDAKKTPYVYRNQKFTPEMLHQFVEITRSFELIKEDDFKLIQSLQSYL